MIGLANPLSKTIYNRTNENNKKCIEIAKILLVILTPISCGLLPLFIIGFFSCFTEQLGENAFVSPFPTW